MLLDDVRVLDLTDHRGEIGPWLLGWLGADVVKVEPPGGSPARREHPLDPAAPAGLASLQFSAYNDNKSSIVLDLDDGADRATLRDLIGTAEIVIDSGPPGRLAAGGISEAELIAANPEVVYVVVTPYGSDGPRADDPFSELSIAALGGPMSLQGVRERAPLKVSVPQVWRHAGAEAALAAMVAYRRMQRTGDPQIVDLSAQCAMTWTMLNAMEAHEVQGFDFERAGSTVALAVAMDLRRRATDGWLIQVPAGITVGPIVPWLIEEGIVDSSWADVDWATYDHRALSGEDLSPNYDDITAALDVLCGRYTRDELLHRGLTYGSTFAPINTVVDLLGVEHLEIRDFWRPMPLPGHDEPVRGGGSPITVDGRRGEPARRLTEPGADDAAVRATLRRRRRSHSWRSADGDRPYAGLKVADFSWIGVGPITAKSFADHGATVVRVETEGRLDTLRAQAPFKDAEFGLNRSNFFGTFNTSKLSMSLDLTTPEGVGVARRLADWADIVIDSFRPGTMEKLGLGPDVLRADHPELITVATSLLASGGPLSPLAGYGFHAGAIAGFTELVGWPDLGPDGRWMAYTDTIAPRFLTTAICAALDRRDRTGAGCHIEAAQLEIGLQLLLPELFDYQTNGDVAQRLGNRDLHMAPQGAYPCAGDDQWCTITVADDEDWQALRTVLGDPDWARDPRLDHAEGRLARHDELDERIAEWTRTREAADVERLVCDAGVAAGKVQRSSDLRVDPQYLHRDFYAHLEHPEVGVVPYAGHQYRIRGYDHGPRAAAPMLGEHTYEVMSDLLEMTPDEIADVAAGGALG